jgi:glycosyltransferase involved in cell wall biosynthesis
MNIMSRSKEEALSVLILEPYYGGSHRAFLKGLKAGLPFRFESITLPARKWKWRMRLAAQMFADELHRSGKRYDRILCSTFVDVAAFRGLAPAWVREVPVLTYFHENQFAYPVQVDDERDFHFALTNMTTALASDSVALNSQHNLDTFLDGITDLVRRADDMELGDVAGAIKCKASIIPPGIDFSAIDDVPEPERTGPPVIVWNHRWEHDKGPELFFETLYTLDEAGVDFRLVVLGQAFERRPPIFTRAKKKLGHRILHFGYVRSREEYARWLRRGDIVVSTARHEFFGIAVLEAVRAGCRPLLPGILSYPELFPEKYLYSDDAEFPARLKEVIMRARRLPGTEARRLTGRFAWDALLPRFAEWLAGRRS